MPTSYGNKLHCEFREEKGNLNLASIRQVRMLYHYLKAQGLWPWLLITSLHAWRRTLPLAWSPAEPACLAFEHLVSAFVAYSA